MARITVEKMTEGQLKMHFAAVCQWHQCDGVAALGRVHKIPVDELRAGLSAYEAAKKRKDWKSAEAALLRLVGTSTRQQG